MSPCHTALHLCIFLSLAGTLPCPSAVALSLCLHLFLLLSLSLFQPVSHSQTSHHVQLSVFQISCYLPQKLSFSNLPPRLYLPQQPPECCPHSLTCCVSTFHLYLLLASHHWAADELCFFITLNSLSLTCSAYVHCLLCLFFCPPSLSSSISQWTFLCLFMTEKTEAQLKESSRQRWRIISFILSIPHSFLLLLILPACLPPFLPSSIVCHRECFIFPVPVCLVTRARPMVCMLPLYHKTKQCACALGPAKCFIRQ